MASLIQENQLRPQLSLRCTLPGVLVLLTLMLLAPPVEAHAQGTPASPAAMAPDLEAARTALAKYADPFVAVKEGFLSTVACIDFPKGAVEGVIEYPAGAMGVHFVNFGNIGPTLDPAKPQVLLYEPVGDKLVLAGAEWFVPAEAVGATPPSIFGQKLAGPMDGHPPIMPASLRHYDLHVWLWKDNPKGIFTSTNSAVKCPAGAAYTVVPHH